MGWIRIRMDPELLPGSGSGSGTRKIQSWIRIRIRNKHSGSTTLLFIKFYLEPDPKLYFRGRLHPQKCGSGSANTASM